MVVKRIPQSVQESRDVQAIEGRFIERVERDNLSVLSLDELANRYQQIEQQGQLLQGRILLEARTRFQGDAEFGQWCAHALCVGGQQHRTRLMNLARFFDGINRTLDKISITAAYEISAPINADVADIVYKEALGKSLSVAEIKAEIAKAKGKAAKAKKGVKKRKSIVLDDVSESIEQVLADVKNLPKIKAVRVLRECIRRIKSR